MAAGGTILMAGALAMTHGAWGSCRLDTSFWIGALEAGPARVWRGPHDLGAGAFALAGSERRVLPLRLDRPRLAAEWGPYGNDRYARLLWCDTRPAAGALFTYALEGTRSGRPWADLDGSARVNLALQLGRPGPAGTEAPGPRRPPARGAVRPQRGAPGAVLAGLGGASAGRPASPRPAPAPRLALSGLPRHPAPRPRQPRPRPGLAARAADGGAPGAQPRIPPRQRPAGPAAADPCGRHRPGPPYPGAGSLDRRDHPLDPGPGCGDRAGPGLERLCLRGRVLGDWSVALALRNAFGWRSANREFAYRSRLPTEPPSGILGRHRLAADPQQLRLEAARRF